MHFYIMTLFVDIIKSYISESIIKRAIENKIIEVDVFNIRDFSLDKHKKVDDYPYGGGGGMVMTPQPIFSCYEHIKSEIEKVSGEKPYLIYFSPKGKRFDNEMAYRLSEKKNLVFLCGHYEGVDQRVIDSLVDEEISLGDFVLTGGELPALCVLDSVSRKLDGVLSEEKSYKDESFEDNLLEYPHYTRPVEFRGMKVPDVLLSGHHENIQKYRKEESIKITKNRRPDLLDR